MFNNNNNENEITPKVFASGKFSCVIDYKGRVYGWGTLLRTSYLRNISYENPRTHESIDKDFFTKKILAKVRPGTLYGHFYCKKFHLLFPFLTKKHIEVREIAIHDDNILCLLTTKDEVYHFINIHSTNRSLYRLKGNYNRIFYYNRRLYCINEEKNTTTVAVYKHPQSLFKLVGKFYSINENAPANLKKIVSIRHEHTLYEFSLFVNGNLECSVPTESLQDKKVIQIAAGTLHVLFLTEDNRVYCFGSNKECQLGKNAPTQYGTPVPMLALLKIPIKKIIAAGNVSICISENNKAYIFSKTFTKVIDKICDAASSGTHHILLTTYGKVFVFGANDHGQLGLGYKSKYATIPQLIPNFTLNPPPKIEDKFFDVIINTKL